MPRPLPTEDEARAILARRKTRPLPRPAPRVGRALEKLIRTLDDRYGRGAEALEARWAEIVGERLAAVTRPQKLTRPRKSPDGRPAGLRWNCAWPAPPPCWSSTSRRTSLSGSTCSSDRARSSACGSPRDRSGRAPHGHARR